MVGTYRWEAEKVWGETKEGYRLGQCLFSPALEKLRRDW